MLRLLLIGPLLVLLILFAVSNMAPIAVGLWPLDVTWQAPLAIVVLLVAALAFLLGAGVAWAAGLPARRRAKAVLRAGRLLDAEVTELRAGEAKRVEAERMSDPVPAPGRALRTVA